MSNYIVTIPLKTEKFQEDILAKKFEECRKIYNSCLAELLKRYNHMRESKEYRRICKLEKGKDRNRCFNELNKKYNLTEYSLHLFVKPMSKYFSADAMTAQKLATRAYSSFEKLMFHTAKRVNFIKYNEMYSIEGKTNKQGIRFRDTKIFFNKMIIPVIIKDSDTYLQMVIQGNIKYCRILKKIIKGKTKWYVQLIIEGNPPLKYDKETGEIKNNIGKGKVGIDIGTSTVAICSSKDVKLLELVPEIQDIEDKKCKLQRKLDRQRRANNPDNYNENGTIKKQGNKKVKWIKSNKYMKTQNQLKELYRKQAEIRKQSHNKLANYIVSLGNEVYVETMNFKGLQKRSKKTTINEKTGKINKKKRFGKSIANKAPAMLVEIINRKLKYEGLEILKINTFTIKASQYNHIKDDYVKKGISERWNDFGEYKIQRDMYSAFLLMCTEGNLKEINKDLCKKEFDNFRKLHNIEVKRIKNSNNKRISSIGI